MAQSSWLPSLWREQRELVEPFQALKRQLDDMFEDWSEGMSAPSMLKPRLEVSESDNDMIITAELPGVEQKDVEVSLSGRHLTIKGEKRSETEETQATGRGRVYHRSERTYGAFQRSILLPFDADPSSIGATFRDGILTVTAQKPAGAGSTATKIEVKGTGAT